MMATKAEEGREQGMGEVGQHYGEQEEQAPLLCCTGGRLVNRNALYFAKELKEKISPHREMVVQGDSCAHDPDLVITYCAHDQQTTLHPINMYNYYVAGRRTTEKQIGLCSEKVAVGKGW
jgi:hypothetical protein